MIFTSDFQHHFGPAKCTLWSFVDTGQLGMDATSTANDDLSSKGKGKNKHGFVLRLVVNTPLRCSGMAHVLKGSQFYLHTPHSSANGMNHTCLCLPSRSGEGKGRYRKGTKHNQASRSPDHQCATVCLLQLGRLTVLLRHLGHNWKHCFLFDCLIMWWQLNYCLTVH